VLRLVTKLKEEMGEENLPIADLCASFQITVAKALTKRAVRACLDLGLDTIAVGVEWLPIVAYGIVCNPLVKSTV